MNLTKTIALALTLLISNGAISGTKYSIYGIQLGDKYSTIEDTYDCDYNKGYKNSYGYTYPKAKCKVETKEYTLYINVELNQNNEIIVLSGIKKYKRVQDTHQIISKLKASLPPIKYEASKELKNPNEMDFRYENDGCWGNTCMKPTKATHYKFKGKNISYKENNNLQKKRNIERLTYNMTIQGGRSSSGISTVLVMSVLSLRLTNEALNKKYSNYIEKLKKGAEHEQK